MANVNWGRVHARRSLQYAHIVSLLRKVSLEGYCSILFRLEYFHVELGRKLASCPMMSFPIALRGVRDSLAKEKHLVLILFLRLP